VATSRNPIPFSGGRKLVAAKFDDSNTAARPVDPRVSAEIENLVVVWPPKTLAKVMLSPQSI
jgi:hypothetical protein